MNIQEATKKAISEGKFIARTDTNFKNLKLKPTNSPDCCIVFGPTQEKGSRRGWQPFAEDLISDCWHVVD